MQLAQINIGRILHPTDDPRMAGFVDNLAAINALAEASDGFVWRLKDDSGNATAISAYADPTILVNMSVWASPEALHAFAYRSEHRAFVMRRKEWFAPFEAPYLALWWIEDGDVPSVAEGRARLDHLTRVGPTAYAFNFRRLFPPGPAEPLVAPEGAAEPGAATWRSCG